MNAKFDSAFRLFRRYRRWFAAALAVIGVAAGLSSVDSVTSQGHPTVVAAHTIPGGAVISEADLTVVALPDAALPQGTSSQASALVGRQALSDIPGRAIVVESNLLGGELASTSGLLKLPVHFSDDAAVSLLRSGQHIDIFGPSGSGGSFALVASDITVLTIPPTEQSTGLGATSSELVVIEVTPEQAASISSAASSTSLSFALR